MQELELALYRAQTEAKGFREMYESTLRLAQRFNDRWESRTDSEPELSSDTAVTPTEDRETQE